MWHTYTVTYLDSTGKVHTFDNYHVDARQAAAEVRWNFDCIEIISVVKQPS